MGCDDVMRPIKVFTGDRDVAINHLCRSSRGHARLRLSPFERLRLRWMLALNSFLRTNGLVWDFMFDICKLNRTDISRTVAAQKPRMIEQRTSAMYLFGSV